MPQTWKVVQESMLCDFSSHNYKVSQFFSRPVGIGKNINDLAKSDKFQEHENLLLSFSFCLKLSSGPILQLQLYMLLRLRMWLWLIVTMIFMCMFYWAKKHVRSLYTIAWLLHCAFVLKGIISNYQHFNYNLSFTVILNRLELIFDRAYSSWIFFHLMFCYNNLYKKKQWSRYIIFCASGYYCTATWSHYIIILYFLWLEIFCSKFCKYVKEMISDLLRYNCTVWFPYTAKNINILEHVQLQAACQLWMGSILISLE